MSLALDGSWGKGPVLLLGAGGQVGTELLRLLDGVANFCAPRRAELDLLNAAALRQIIDDVKPRWILNAAAYTAVDRAESEPALAYAINAEAVRVVGEQARLSGAAVVHFSTDYVFDGAEATPRGESDPTGPLGTYGASKLAGENALIQTGAPHFIFRTSWVYSAHGKNFMLTMLKLAAERDELRVVADQVGAPTHARDLAHLVQYAVSETEKIAAQEQLPLSEALGRNGGLYHACNSGETSWFQFAESFLHLACRAGYLKCLPTMTPITTAEYPTPARRPAYSRLCCTRLQEQLGYTMAPWEDSMKAALNELYAKRAAEA